MNRESEQYRFARVEAYQITLAHLEKQFKDRAINLVEVEAAVAEQLAKESLCAPWRKSEIERAGCREGMQPACRQFLSQDREKYNTSGCEAAQGGSIALRCFPCFVSFIERSR